VAEQVRLYCAVAIGVQRPALAGLNQWPAEACPEEGIMERAKKEPVRLESVAEQVRLYCAVANGVQRPALADLNQRPNRFAFIAQPRLGTSAPRWRIARQQLAAGPPAA